MPRDGPLLEVHRASPASTYYCRFSSYKKYLKNKVVDTGDLDRIAKHLDSTVKFSRKRLLKKFTYFPFISDISEQLANYYLNSKGIKMVQYLLCICNK